MMIAQERLPNDVDLGRRPGGPRPGRRHGRGRPLYFPETTYIYPAYRHEGDSVEGEVAAYENRMECVVLRRGYGPWLVRRVVIDALKGRGWVERAEEAGTLLLCPPPAEATRIRGLMVVHPRMGWSGNFPQEQFYPWHSMGQAAKKLLRVVVTDRKGNPAKDIQVVVTVTGKGGVGEGVTDADGVFELLTAEPLVVPIVSLPEGEVRSSVPMSESGTTATYFRSLRIIDGPFVTGFEAAAGFGGIALSILGAFIGEVPGKVLVSVGSSGLAAAVLSSLSRRM